MVFFNTQYHTLYGLSADETVKNLKLKNFIFDDYENKAKYFDLILLLEREGSFFKGKKVNKMCVLKQGNKFF